MFPGIVRNRRRGSWLAEPHPPEMKPRLVAGIVLPVQAGMTQFAREALEALAENHADDIEACCTRIGIDWMSWHLAVLPERDYLIIHLRGSGSGLFLGRLEQSIHPFDSLLKSRLAEITGFGSEWESVAQWLIPMDGD